MRNRRIAERVISLERVRTARDLAADGRQWAVDPVRQERQQLIHDLMQMIAPPQGGESIASAWARYLGITDNELKARFLAGDIDSTIKRPILRYYGMEHLLDTN